jgi:hypothetical protein
MPFTITPHEIEKTELKVGYVFPRSLKNSYVEDNGGDMEILDDVWQLVPFLDSSDPKRFSRTCNDIVKETSLQREVMGFAEDGFVIAQNGAGDCLFILPESEGSKSLGEAIFFWNHETREHRKVADNFDSLD